MPIKFAVPIVGSASYNETKVPTGNIAAPVLLMVAETVRVGQTPVIELIVIVASGE